MIIKESILFNNSLFSVTLSSIFRLNLCLSIFKILLLSPLTSCNKVGINNGVSSSLPNMAIIFNFFRNVFHLLLLLLKKSYILSEKIKYKDEGLEQYIGTNKIIFLYVNDVSIKLYISSSLYLHAPLKHS